MKKITISASFLILLQSLSIPLTQAADASNKALQQQVTSLQSEVKSMRKDLQEIKLLLLQMQNARTQPSVPAAAPTAPLISSMSVDGLQFKGDTNAKVTLIEFTDYQCPFCIRHIRNTYPSIEKDYIQTGKVKYVMSDFPLVDIHAQAMKASEASYCADEQGKYWEMHDLLFGNPGKIGLADLPGHAQSLGLDVNKFNQCLYNNKYEPKIQQRMTMASQAGITSTPNFFIGLTMPNNQVKIVKKITGAKSYALFKTEIDALLGEHAAPNGAFPQAAVNGIAPLVGLKPGIEKVGGNAVLTP